MQHPMAVAKRQKRKKYLLDTRQQLPAVLVLVGACLGCAALFVGVGVTFSGLGLKDMTSTGAGRLALVLDLFYFLTVAAAVAFVGIRITHRVIGPLRVLTGAVQQLREGDYTGRLAIRHGDFMKELATAIGDLSQGMREADARRRVFHRELVQCLEAGDLEAARRLAQREVERSTSVEPSAPAPVESTT